jgi:hypothetical protein
MTDNALTRLVLAVVLAVAAGAAFVSAIHIYALAGYLGQIRAAAYVMPASIDLEIAACSLTLLRAARLTRCDPPPLARPGLILGVLVTLGCNVGYGLVHHAHYGPVRATAASAFSGWPAVAFIICTEVAVSMVRRAARTRKTAPAEPDQPAPPRPQPPGQPAQQWPASAMQAYQDSRAGGGKGLSERQVAALLGTTSRRQARNMMAAASNGAHGGGSQVTTPGW